MFDQDAIEALQQGAAIDQAGTSLQIALRDGGADGLGAVALPSTFQVHDLEKMLSTRRRARGAMKTSDLGSFADYVTAHAEAGCTVFVDAAQMSATAVLNLGTLTSPGHTDNRAVYSQPRTAAFAALVEIANGSARTQRDIAEFMEDWGGSIKCFNGNDPLPAGLAIAAVRAITIDTARKVESTDQQLSASRSAFETVQASAKTPLPTTIYFECKPYADIDARTFVLRLGVLTTGEKVALNLRIQQPELHNEEISREMASKIRDKFTGSASGVATGGSTISVVVGTYTAAA